MNLMTGFISAIQSFSREITGSNVKTINFDNFIFHFYKDPRYNDLIFLFITDNDFKKKYISCKIQKMADLFINKYSERITDFDGQVGQFDDFIGFLEEEGLSEPFCGDNQKCVVCPYLNDIGFEGLEFERDKKEVIPILNKLLYNLLNNIDDIIASFIIDFNCYTIAKQTKKPFSNQDYLDLMNSIDLAIEQLKNRKSKLGQGIIDTDDFRIVYIGLGKKTPALLICVFDSYLDINNVIPFLYIIVEKISLILNNRKTSLNLPISLKRNKIKIKKEDSLNTTVKNILIIGDQKVGKTALSEILSRGTFTEEYKPTLGLSIVEKKFSISKRSKMKFRLFDFSGLEKFSNIRQFYYKALKFKTILILFDYTDEKTLDRIIEWLEEAQYHIENGSAEYIIVGNKFDLSTNGKDLKRKAERIATQYRCDIISTSALTGRGIDELFMQITS